jgi:hypothetical protein
MTVKNLAVSSLFAFRVERGCTMILTLYYAGVAGSSFPPYNAAKIPNFTELETDVVLFVN